jgi:hypothetical protein
MRVPLPIAGGAYQGRSPLVGIQECVNWYPERQADGKATYVLYPTPGLVLERRVGAGPIRALHGFRGKVLAVSGGDLYEDGAKVGTQIGPGPVRMTTGINGVFLTDGRNGFRWDGTTFQQVSLPAPAGSCTFLNTYLLFIRPGTSDFFYSQAGGLTWDALDFDQAITDADENMAIVSHLGEVWIFGAASYEVWSFTGTDPLFVRSGASGAAGLAAARSLARLGGTLYWLASDNRGAPFVAASQGYAAVPVSTPEIGYQISTFPRTDDAFGFAYTDGGHPFYVLTFPGAKRTLVYDTSTAEWHERSTYGLGHWRPSCHVHAGGRHLVGDPTSGDIWRLDPGVYTDGDLPIRRVRRVRLPFQGGRRVFVGGLELHMQPGVGVASGQGAQPQAMLRVSRDGGRTWGPEQWRPIGGIGQYRAATRWNRLGAPRDAVIELSVSDPVEAVVIGAEVDAEAGVS